MAELGNHSFALKAQADSSIHDIYSEYEYVYYLTSFILRILLHSKKFLKKNYVKSSIELKVLSIVM